MRKIAIYPGTFDPVTFGHLDIIERATKVFDHLIVAVALNAKKSPLFSIAERIDLLKQSLPENSRVEVVGFENLLTDFATEKKAGMIVRGLRAVSDFEFEFQLAGMNRHIAPDLESLFLMPAEKYMCVSSRLVREISNLGGDVAEFVPPVVVAALEKKLRG